MTTLPTFLDLAAIATGGLFGAALAVQRKSPIVGVMLLAVLTALGGGMIRDALLNVPIVAMTNDAYLPVAVAAALLGLPLARRITEHPYIGLTLDALVLGLYVLVGTEKASSLGYGAAACVFVGLITAIGGGTIADLMLGKTPTVLERGPWFASAAIAGATVYVLLETLIDDFWLRAITVAVVALLRFFSERLGWDAPSVETLKNFKRSRD